MAKSWTPAADFSIQPLICSVSLPKFREKMPEKSRYPGLAAAALLTLAHSGAASAQALPSIDQALTLRSADNDPDLVAARENYDPNTHTQSLYLRVNDGTPDRQAFSGQLIVRGAEVVRVIVAGDELANSDATWGIPGVDYGGAVGRRGLDGADPLTHVPVLGDPTDAVRIENPRTVRFYLGTDDDIDDLRIVIRYPGEPGPASFDILLFSPARPDPLLWPMTQQGGLQVGSLVDAIPDDGDYSEVFEIRSIKLRIEDLDVVEDAVTIGHVPLAGGIAGPAVVTLDNFASGTDFDQDNGFDQNGLITPIPAGSDLEHLVFNRPPLVNARFGGMIAADAIRLEAPPTRIGVGESLPVSMTVVVPAGLPNGAYTSRMEVFEDNSGDGVRNGGEPVDFVNLTVLVGEVPDGGFDLGPPDLGIPDMGSTDGAGADLQREDRGASAEMGGRTDTGGPTDAVADAVADAGAEAGTDGGEAGRRDGAAPRDGRVPDTGADVALADGAADGPRPADSRPPSEAGAAKAEDFGTPRGGAFSCHAAGGPSRGSPLPWMLVATAALVPIIRRRR